MAERCNACGGSLSTRFERVIDPQSMEPFQIHACADCGLGHTVPQPEDLGRYYGAAYHGGRHGVTAAYCAWRRIRFVESVLPEPGRLLDVGCGDGTFLLAMHKRGWEPVGTEMNPSIARKAGLEVFETLEEAKARGPYRCATLWHSLEHLRDPRAAMATLFRLVEPGGVVLISVPDAEGLQARLFGPRWFHLDVPRHLFHFGNRSLSRLVAGSGFDILRRWHQELELDLFGWTQSALNALFPRPNVFFHHLTGRPTSAGGATVVTSYALGTALTAIAVPATAAATALGRGATLVLAARKPLLS